MKLTTNAENLSRKLVQHDKIVQQKSSIFTSDAVLLSANVTVYQYQGSIQLVSTDQTTYLVNSEPAEVTEPGQVLVPFKLLKDIVSNLSGKIIIEGDEKKLQISSDKAHYDLACYQMDTFPSSSEIKEERDYQFELNKCSSAIDRVLPCGEYNQKRRLEFKRIKEDEELLEFLGSKVISDIYREWSRLFRWKWKYSNERLQLLKIITKDY